MYLPCTLSQEATGRCAPPEQGSNKKDENMGYRIQECQYRRDVKGGPWMVMKEDLNSAHQAKQPRFEQVRRLWRDFFG